jgi:hypothetical protein
MRRPRKPRENPLSGADALSYAILPVDHRLIRPHGERIDRSRTAWNPIIARRGLGKLDLNGTGRQIDGKQTIGTAFDDSLVRTRKIEDIAHVYIKLCPHDGLTRAVNTDRPVQTIQGRWRDRLRLWR